MVQLYKHRNSYANSCASLASLAKYKASESAVGGATDREGNLYEHQVYELRLHPPNVEVDNATYTDRTLLTVDSANRPGTLVEVVQCLTEMGLSIRKARISSDGTWFVDEFVVDRVTDIKKLQTLRDVLSAGPSSADMHSSAQRETTVFELAGTDQGGLLADVVALLENNNCLVQSLALWTHNKRVAAVISVEEKGLGMEGGLHAASSLQCNAHTDAVKSLRLKQLLCQMLDSCHQGDAIVEVSTVRGPIHHERRLHQLLLKEEEHNWCSPRRSNLAAEYEQLVACSRPTSHQSAPPPGSPQSSPAGAAVDEGVSPTPTPLALSTPLCTQPSPAHARLGKSNLSRVSGSGEHCSTAACFPTLAEHEPLLLPPIYEAAGGGCSRRAAVEVGGRADSAARPQPQLQLAAAAAVPPKVEGGRAEDAHTPSKPLSSSLSAVTELERVQALETGLIGLSSLSLPDASTMPQHPSPPPSVSSSVTSASSSARSQGCGSNTSSSGSSTSSGSSGKPPSGVRRGGLAGTGGGVGPQLLSPKACKPQIHISHEPRRNYWLVCIHCKDRKKLLFDTMCTLADLEYDVYHASVDVEGEWVEQQYYVRMRYGDSTWSVPKAARLRYMLEASIQRRHPKGAKVHIQSGHAYDLGALTAAWRQAGLWITRAKASPSCPDGFKGASSLRFANTFYVLDRNGNAPDISLLQRTCISQGGKPVFQHQQQTQQQALQQAVLQAQAQQQQQVQQQLAQLAQQQAQQVLMHTQQQRVQGWANEQLARAEGEPPSCPAHQPEGLTAPAASECAGHAAARAPLPTADAYPLLEVAPAAHCHLQAGELAKAPRTEVGAGGGVPTAAVPATEHPDEREPAGLGPAGDHTSPAFAFAVMQRSATNSAGSRGSSVASSM